MTKSEALYWLMQYPDARGECDGCHREGCKLWALPLEFDHEPEAAWLYCHECYRKRVNARDDGDEPIEPFTPEELDEAIADAEKTFATRVVGIMCSVV